jgi:aryl-alcohol dehydrogenase-like predicted oxidoreductase
MEMRRVPHTDLEVSRLVMGTMTFGSQVDEQAAAEMIGRCLDEGINMFDTANAYNEGLSEEILGKLIAPHRAGTLIATKVFNPMGEAPDDRGLSRAAIHKAIEASLRRLGTDYIDLYYFHQPDWDTGIEESLEALQELVDAGKVRYAGLSNYAAWQIAEIHCLQAAAERPPLCVSQQLYNLLARRLDDEYAAFSNRYDIFDIVYNPLAGGLLTGKHRRQQAPEQGTRFSQAMYRQRYWDEQHFAALEDLRNIAGDAGLDLVQLSFRWLLGQDLVDAVLLGASSMEHLEKNLEACRGPRLDHDTLKRCDEVWERLHGPAASYNR